MCGIAGIVSQTGPIGKDGVDLFLKLMDQNVERGCSSVGIVSDTECFKFLAPEGWAGAQELVEERVKTLSDSNILLGHTRAPTSGIEPTLETAHPFKYGDLYVAHNGILHNHKALKSSLDYPSGAPKVDSHVIGMLAQRLGSCLTPDDSILAACSLLQGSFACWFKYRSRVAIVRNISSVWTFPWIIAGAGANSGLVFSSSKWDSDCILMENGEALFLSSSLTGRKNRVFPSYTPYLV